MGFKLDLLKENNFINTDFKDAYWKIDEVGIGEQGGIFGVYYTLIAYPSREASKVEGKEVKLLPFGGSTKFNYEPALYKFIDFEPTDNIFHNNIIPNDLNEIKSKIYLYVKNKFNLTTAVDVFEEGQQI